MAPNAVPGTSGSDDAPKLTRWERLKYTLIRPDDEGSKEPLGQDRSTEEVHDDVRRANDKERAWGLILGPAAAAVGVIIGSASISYARDHHQSTTVFVELTYVLLGLSVLILVSALWRKRLFVGIALALYGLAVFNLHYPLFGIPFLLAGAWYLVRAYRLQQELKRVEGDIGGSSGRGRASPAHESRPRPNKRYTPPS